MMKKNVLGMFVFFCFIFTTFDQAYSISLPGADKNKQDIVEETVQSPAKPKEKPASDVIRPIDKKNLNSLPKTVLPSKSPDPKKPGPNTASQMISPSKEIKIVKDGYCARIGYSKIGIAKFVSPTEYINGTETLNVRYEDIWATKLAFKNEMYALRIGGNKPGRCDRTNMTLLSKRNVKDLRHGKLVLPGFKKHEDFLAIVMPVDDGILQGSIVFSAFDTLE